MDDFKSLLDRLDRIEHIIMQQGLCTRDKDILLEVEKVRGEMRALSERERVREGMSNSQVTRLHDRLDKLQAENASLTSTMTTQDHVHTSEIHKINMHLRYTLGAFAALVFLLNFFDKIRAFLGALVGGKP